MPVDKQYGGTGKERAPLTQHPSLDLWGGMLRRPDATNEAFREFVTAPRANAVTREPSTITRQIERTGDAVRFSQEIPLSPTARAMVASPRTQATMATRGRARTREAALRRNPEQAQPGEEHYLRAGMPNREAGVTRGQVPGQNPQPLTAELPREARAVLDVISQFEGTNRYANNGYNTLVGGRQIEDLSRHPSVVGVTTVDGPSRAFGRYQFIPDTWNMAAAALNLTDMSQQSQDRAAWWLAQRAYRGATGRELGQDVVDPTRWDSIAGALGTQWASFPGNLGRNQRQYDMSTFRDAIQRAIGGATSAQPRSASEFLGLDTGVRAPTQGRNLQDFMSGRDRPIQTRRRRPNGGS